MISHREELDSVLLLLRAWLGDTQKSFAAKCGVHPTNLSNLEHNRRPITTNWITKLSQATHVHTTCIMPFYSAHSTDEEKEFNLFLIFEKLKSQRNISSEIGMILAMLRINARFDERELATRLTRKANTQTHWTAKTISNFENGTTPIQHETLKIYAKYFKVPIQYLKFWQQDEHTDAEKQKLLYELYKISERKGSMLI